MGLKFHKRIKIAPGVKINITPKGISSVSLGGKGATVNLGKKGINATASIPGTGLSYTHKLSGGINSKKSVSEPQALTTDQLNIEPKKNVEAQRKVSFLLGIGILVMPYIFVWFLLQSGYSKSTRYISFGWLIMVVLIMRSQP
jgi:hypothetical protein